MHAATRDDSLLPEAVQSSRGGTKIPLDMAIMDLPGPGLQAHDTQVHWHAAPVPPAGDAGAQAMRSHDMLPAHDIPLVQLSNTTRHNDNSDPN